MKKICDSTTDVISDLPGIILDYILMSMPLRDAVRTSVLSKKWRYKWALIPHLAFDDNIMTVVPRHDKTRKKLMLIISQVLMLHLEPILKFTLSIRELEGCPEIDNLITFLASKGVEELALLICKGETYKLPSSIFSCQRLTHLNLRCCKFTPPATFKGFSKLVCLELCEVVISIDTLARLISTCPLLQQLRLESSMTSGPLEIDSGSLKRSYFGGNFKSISFKNASHLAVVSLLSKEPASNVEPSKADSIGWNNFLPSLPALENLEMDEHYVKSCLKTMTSWILNMRPLKCYAKRLEILKIYGICLDHRAEFDSVIYLFLAPKLRKVTIEAKPRGRCGQGQEFVQQKISEKIFFNQLREVQLGITSGTAAELELIKIILAKSTVLEKMVVKPDPGRDRDGGLKILRELTAFERLSCKAKVVYEDPGSAKTTGGRKF